MTSAIARRRLAHDLSEGTAEGAEAREGDVEADVGDAPIALAEQEHGALDPSADKVAVRSLAEDRTETPAEMGRRDVGNRRHRADIQGLGVRAVHGIAGAQQAPIEILGLATHPTTLRDAGRSFHVLAPAEPRRHVLQDALDRVGVVLDAELVRDREQQRVGRLDRRVPCELLDEDVRLRGV